LGVGQRKKRAYGMQEKYRKVVLGVGRRKVSNRNSC